MISCIIPKSNNHIFPIHSGSREVILQTFGEKNLSFRHPLTYQNRGRGGTTCPASAGYNPEEKPGRSNNPWTSAPPCLCIKLK